SEMVPLTATVRPFFDLYRSALRLRVRVPGGESALRSEKGTNLTPERAGVNAETSAWLRVVVVPKPPADSAWSRDAGTVATVNVEPAVLTDVTSASSPPGVFVLVPATTMSPAVSPVTCAGGLV